MHICIFFDDIITPPFETRRPIFLTQFFSILGHNLFFFGDLIEFLAFLDPKLGPMNGELIRKIP